LSTPEIKEIYQIKQVVDFHPCKLLQKNDFSYKMQFGEKQNILTYNKNEFRGKNEK